MTNDQHLRRLCADLALVAEVIPTHERLAQILRCHPCTIGRTLARGRLSGYMSRRWLDCQPYLGLARGLRRGAEERQERRQLDIMSGPAWR